MGGIAGTLVTFQIVLKDKYGNIATNANANTQVSVTITGEGNVTQSQSLVENGVVTINYTTIVAGEYDIEINGIFYFFYFLFFIFYFYFFFIFFLVI